MAAPTTGAHVLFGLVGNDKEASTKHPIFSQVFYSQPLTDEQATTYAAEHKGTVARVFAFGDGYFEVRDTNAPELQKHHTEFVPARTSIDRYVKKGERVIWTDA